MNRRKKRNLSLTQKTILAIILSSFFIVALLIICMILNSTEKRVKSTLTDLASNYYKQQIYQNIAENNTENDTKTILAELKDTGFAIVYLRQLVYFNQENKDAVNLVKNHCDENKTFVKFYPEPPYSETSYRADFTYSCEFK